jgi:SAM-dependent methyltransferase
MRSALKKWLRARAEKDGRGYPDWALRYLPVVRRLGRKLDGARVLEVGANRNGLARFAPVPVVAVNLAQDQLREAREEARVLPVRADMTALPFKPGTFDIVVCMDTYEHVSRETRDQGSVEIVRVLAPRGTAAIGFPAGSAARAAEARVRAAYQRATGRKLRWLEEHTQYDLPSSIRIFAHLAEHTRKTHVVRRVRNTSIVIWEWMWKVLICDWPGRYNAAFQFLLRLLVPVISRWHVGRCYRALIYVEPRDK